MSVLLHNSSLIRVLKATNSGGSRSLQPAQKTLAFSFRRNDEKG
jgi:hypothetical protein